MENQETDKRLRAIEVTQAAALVLLDELHDKMDKVDTILVGNGSGGHNVRLDRLEQAAAGARRLFYTLVIPVGLLCVKAVAGLLGTPEV